VIEFKGPKTSVNFKHFLQGIGYICVYYQKEKILEKEIYQFTYTLICAVEPVSLLKELRNDGFQIEKRLEGIYDVYTRMPFPIQIVILKELDPQKHPYLRVFSSVTNEEDLKKFVQQKDVIKEDEDEHWKELMNFLAEAYPNKMKKVKEMEDMGPYFRELMSDEINAAFQEGEQLGISKGEKTGFSKGEKTGFSKGEKTGFSKGEKTGFSKGEKTGFIKGELHTKRTIAKNLWDNEVAVDTIAKSLSVSEAQVEEWIKSELN
jgi:flagellar biosynthesis/type III secretory pathway protein FliH